MSNQPKPSNQPATAPEPKLVQLLNTENRMYRILARPLDRQQAKDPNTGASVVSFQPLDAVSLAPGLNFVDPEFLKRAGFEGERVGPIEVTDIANVPAAHAMVIAGKCGSRPALKRWLANEKRDNVRAAIETRLQSRKVVG